MNKRNKNIIIYVFLALDLYFLINSSELWEKILSIISIVLFIWLLIAQKNKLV